MDDPKIKNHTLTDWLSNIRSWVLFSITLASILVGAVTQIAGMKQQIALLNQKVEILLGDHEKRISALEADDKTLNSRLDRLETLNQK
jgi:hypothetical protein